MKTLINSSQSTTTCYINSEHIDVEDFWNYSLRTGNLVKLNYQLWGCFAGFLGTSYYDNLHFAFPYLYPVVDKVVEEFNQRFENIKIEVVGKKEFRIIRGNNTWDSISYAVFEDDSDYNSCNEQEYVWRIYHIKFAEGYKRGVKLYLQYFIHHILRTFSVTEDLFIGNEKDIILQNEFAENIIEQTLHLFNLHYNEVSHIRSLWEIPLNPSIIFNMDDIEFMNKQFSYSSGKQTKIGLLLSPDYVEGFTDRDDLYIDRVPRVSSVENFGFVYYNREAERSITGIFRTKTTDMSKLYIPELKIVPNIGMKFGMESPNVGTLIGVNVLLSILDPNHPSAKLVEFLPTIEEILQKTLNGLLKDKTFVRAKINDQYYHFLPHAYAMSDNSFTKLRLKNKYSL